MRRSSLIAAAIAATTAGLLSVGPAAAQDNRPTYRMEYSRSGEPLRLNVRPRSWLELGPTVAPYSSVNPASAAGQTVSYLLSPPWQGMRDRFGEGVLPDPLTNAPFVGGRSLLGPVDYLDDIR